MPPKGSTVHLVLSTPTTSMCATSSSARDGSATAELCRRATSALRPGASSRSSDEIPSFSRTPAMYFAASCSLPGGLVVLMRIRSMSQPCASLAMAVVSPTGLAGKGGVLAGIPGAAGTCAKAGVLVTRDATATRTATATPNPACNLCFASTNASSSLCGLDRDAPGQFASGNLFLPIELHTNTRSGTATRGRAGWLRNFNGSLAGEQRGRAVVGA